MVFARFFLYLKWLKGLRFAGAAFGTTISKIFIVMITQTKEQYFPPRCEEMAINPDDVIAVSPGKYNNPFEDGGEW